MMKLQIHRVIGPIPNMDGLVSFIVIVRLGILFRAMAVTDYLPRTTREEIVESAPQIIDTVWRKGKGITISTFWPVF